MSPWVLLLHLVNRMWLDVAGQPTQSWPPGPRASATSEPGSEGAAVSARSPLSQAPSARRAAIKAAEAVPGRIMVDLPMGIGRARAAPLVTGRRGRRAPRR